MLLAVECNYGWAVLQLNAMVVFFQETLEDDVQAKTAPGREGRIRNVLAGNGIHRNQVGPVRSHIRQRRHARDYPPLHG